MPSVRLQGFTFSGKYSPGVAFADGRIAYELILEAAAVVGTHSGVAAPSSRFLKYHGTNFYAVTSIVFTANHPVNWVQVYEAVDLLGDTILDTSWTEVGHSPFRAVVKHLGSPLFELRLKANGGGEDMNIDNTGRLDVVGKQFPKAPVILEDGSAHFDTVIAGLERRISRARGNPLIVDDGLDLSSDQGVSSFIMLFRRAAGARWPVFLEADVQRLLNRMRSYFFHRRQFEAFSGSIIFSGSNGVTVDVGWMGFYQDLYLPWETLGNSSTAAGVNSSNPILSGTVPDSQPWNDTSDLLESNGSEYASPQKTYPTSSTIAIS